MITDGTYDSMGYNASHGGSFAFERYTGAPLAIMVAEKCRTCKDRNVYKYPSTCRNGKFHGTSGDMEKYNILRLFEHSLEIGFMYKTVVMDGDCAVLPALKKLQPYDDQLPEKVECGGHLSKNAYTKVTNFGKRWTVERGRKYEQDRLVSEANAEVQAQAA